MIMSAKRLDLGCSPEVGVELTIDGTHDEPYLGGIGGAGEVSVDLLCFGLIERHESVQNVVACCGIIRAT